MIDARFFTANRERLTHLSVIVVTAHTAMQLTHDVAGRFEQESNFWYLTGIEEPDWRLIIANGESWLVAPDIDEVHRVFDGALSDNEAKKRSGIDKVLLSDEGEKFLHHLAKEYTTAYTLGPHPHRQFFNFVENPAQARLRRQLKKQFVEVHDIRRELSRLRAIKQADEITLIRRAVERTCLAFDALKGELSTLEYEYQAEARFAYEFRRSGYVHGYEPIVAAGINACTLHYVKNNDRISDGDLVLFDVGAKQDGYSADISRTYVKGNPTKRQIAIHAAVESAHHEIISLLQPGYPIRDYLQAVDDIMKSALRDVGLASDDEQYRRYFPHAISHGLGIDIHDSLGGFEVFQPGMVLTVEPGIYINEEAIGVRIEDDIVITESGAENLSAHLSTALR